MCRVGAPEARVRDFSKRRILAHAHAFYASKHRFARMYLFEAVPGICIRLIIATWQIKLDSPLFSIAVYDRLASALRRWGSDSGARWLEDDPLLC